MYNFVLCNNKVKLLADCINKYGLKAMKECIDPHTGEKWIELNKEEIKIGFLAQCVEALAESEGVNYTDMFNRMEAADMTEEYILKYYETLHTQSWENVLEDLKELLTKREIK